MSIEVIEVSPHISVPQAGSTVAGEVFRQLLQQAIRVADQANSQSVRMATDFAEVYRREQSVRLEYETKLREMRLLERQSTRYAEDLADMLRKERERREQLETALESERIANEELRRTGLQGISHLLLAATIKDQTTGAHLLRVRKYVEAAVQDRVVDRRGHGRGHRRLGRAVRPRGRRCLPVASGRRKHRARQAGGRDRAARLSLRPVHASAPPPTALATHESATNTASAPGTNQSGTAAYRATRSATGPSMMKARTVPPISPASAPVSAPARAAVRSSCARWPRTR